MNYSFSKYLLELANYGLGPIKDPTKAKSDPHDTPITQIPISCITSRLRKMGVGTHMEANKDSFPGTVEWGNIKVIFMPEGGMNATIRKKMDDLEGNPTWVCQDVIELEDYENPEKIIDEIIQSVRNIDKEGISSPKKEYNDLKALSLDIVSEINHNRTKSKKFLMYDGIKISSEHRYIICYNVTGNGQCSNSNPQPKKIWQFQIFVEFIKEKGLLKVTGNELSSDIGSNSPQYEASDFGELFSPYMEKSKIAKICSDLINLY